MTYTADENIMNFKDILPITLRSIGDAVICTNTFGTISFMNPVAEILTGYTSAEAIGRHIDECFEIINVFSRDKVANPVARVLESGTIVGLANHTLLISKDGKEYHISDSGAPIVSESGELLGVVLVFRDVSDQYDAEAKIIESEGKFRTLFENMEEGVALHDLVFDENGNVINYCLTATNPAYKKHTGISINPGETKLATEVYQTEPAPYLEEFSGVALTGQTKVFETYFPPLGRHFNVSIVQTRKNSFATIFEDITGRINTLEALKESENRFRKIFEDSADAIILIRNGRIIDCNLASLVMLKFTTKDELIGKTPEGISPPYQFDGSESREKANKMMQIAYRKGSNRFEWTHTCADGQFIECEIMLTSMRHQGQDMLHAVMRDITLQKTALIKLTESEEKFRTLYETMAQGVLYFNDKFEIVSANRSAESIFEVESIDLKPIAIDMAMYRYFSIEGKEFEFSELPLFRALQFGEKLRNFAMGISSPRMSKQKWLNVNTVPIFEPGNPKPVKAYLTVEDITELIETEKELQHEKERAEQSDKLKTAFLANMSHEIRTPMNAIMGFSQLLQNPSLHEASRQYYAEIINNSCKNLLRIIDDLLDISKVESGQMTLQMSAVNLNALFDKTYSVFLQSIKSKKTKNIELVYKKPAETCVIEADETRLQQILNNLIENAIKFTEEGTVEFGVQVHGDTLEIFVEDTGIGIPEALHDKVFERFWQAKSEKIHSQGGTGLGLPICQKLAELMGGVISFTSIPGKGSRFVLKIPFIPIDYIRTDSIEKAIKPNHTNNLKILVVEDDLINAQYLREVLKRYPNCLADFVYDGMAAIEKIKENIYDIILLDIQLPGIDGYETASRIRQFNKDVIIIAQTAFAMSDDKTRCIQAGCNNYISKPINYHELYEMLESYTG